MAADFLPGFAHHRIETAPGVVIHARSAGSGPPVLLLHGHPQTLSTWLHVAPRLAQGRRVVAMDLRGYGDSGKPEGGERHEAYAKRAMAADAVAVMRALGHDRFAVVGHDRGGRVAHRLALDHPRAVERIVVMDIAPTATVYARTDKNLATSYFWWFFFIQPAPLPEKLIGADPEYFLRHHIENQSKTPGSTPPDLFAEYLRCYSDAAPLLALWGARGVVGRTYDVLEVWREKAEHVSGRALDCGHNLQEERPDDVMAELMRFLP